MTLGQQEIATAVMNKSRITNFGGNQAFQPRDVFAPRSEDEVLEVLLQCRGRRIRAIGRLHSWSEAAVGEDVVLDLRNLNEVKAELRGDRWWVTAAGGCQIKKLLAELPRLAEGTLPSLGLITEQTVAGAISTATHGSGRSSMSNYIDEIRVATYDPVSCEPLIRTFSSGDDLRAARCSLGAIGIILSVGFWARPAYRIEEFFRAHDDLASVLAMEESFPLQQFFLMPWRWNYMAQHRRETTLPRGGWATLYRVYFFLQFDVGLHLWIVLVVRWLRSGRLVKALFRRLTPRLVIQNWHVVDDSAKMLVMEHELFRHIECELFVPASRLAPAMDLVVKLLKFFDGDAGAIDEETRWQLAEAGIDIDAGKHCGSYTHHYPICLRRVLPDDALISITGDSAEPWYAVSFISYARVGERQGFMGCARVLCAALGRLYGARPHWGKICPLSAEDVRRLYPNWEQFVEVCRGADPAGTFRGEWLKRLFGQN